jgi:GTPase
VNKVDHGGLESIAMEFEELGFEKIFPLSAIHGLGMDDLMETALKFLPPRPEGTEAELGAEVEPPLKLAVIGRPNVGKSSLINALTQSERVVVSPIPGTTRDAIDVPFEVEIEGGRERYVLIDTAGVRQQRRIDNSIEFYSVKRTEDSIARCDIAIFVIDAEAGVTAHDKKVAGKIVEEKKGCILVVNKWDLVHEEVQEARKEEIARRDRKERSFGRDKKMTTLGEFGDWVQRQLFFLDYAPVIFTSAKSGFHLERLLEAIRYVAAQMRQSIPTALLNRTLQDAIERRQPVSATGNRLKLFYATQAGQAPPVFILFVNRDELFSDSYYKYLGGELRRAFGFEGAPIILVAKPRPKTVEMIRQRGRPPQKRPARQRSRAPGEGPARQRSRAPGEGPARRKARPPQKGPARHAPPQRKAKRSQGGRNR